MGAICRCRSKGWTTPSSDITNLISLNGDAQKSWVGPDEGVTRNVNNTNTLMSQNQMQLTRIETNPYLNPTPDVTLTQVVNYTVSPCNTAYLHFAHNVSGPDGSPRIIDGGVKGTCATDAQSGAPIWDNCGAQGSVLALVRNYWSAMYFGVAILEIVLFSVAMLFIDWPDPPRVSFNSEEFKQRRTDDIRKHKVALLIAHYGNFGALEDSLEPALAIFPPENIFVCHNVTQSLYSLVLHS